MFKEEGCASRLWQRH